MKLKLEFIVILMQCKFFHKLGILYTVGKLGEALQKKGQPCVLTLIIFIFTAILQRQHIGFAWVISVGVSY